MIMCLSIAFENLLAPSIAPQLMPLYGEGKVRKYLFGKEKINGEGTRLTHNCSSQVDIGKFGI